MNAQTIQTAETETAETATARPLSGHVSPETAYVVADYPYSFRLRCQIRYWIESSATRGYRFVSQTTNPKRGDTWNRPKASTYARLGAAMFVDEQGHVRWSGITEYSDAKAIRTFLGRAGARYHRETLLVLCIGRASLADRTIRGEAVFTLNGVPQIPGLTEIERATEQAAIYRECIAILKSAV